LLAVSNGDLDDQLRSASARDWSPRRLRLSAALARQALGSSSRRGSSD
jgi:hypothetical protein